MAITYVYAAGHTASESHMYKQLVHKSIYISLTAVLKSRVGMECKRDRWERRDRVGDR